ncbi:MAG: putative peptide maturation dehydrogenase [Solirubrobacteraceae bacterium]
MAKIRRTLYAFFYLEDDHRREVAALLGGEATAPARGTRILALAVLTGERHRLGSEEMEVLQSVPAGRWVDDGGRDPAVLSGLIDKGLLLSDEDHDARLSALRERDAALTAGEWNLYAALYHHMTQWSGLRLPDGEAEDVLLKARARSAAADFVARHGPAPGAFAAPRSASRLPLPGMERDGAVFRALTARRTTRSFDHDGPPMTLEQLDIVLRYVFGCHGYGTNVADMVCIKRTSPSGGGLHPIEAYPIVADVAGIQSGIYQYAARDHSLALLEELEPTEARRTATSFMCGQGYFGAAHVSFVLTARFSRSHWKYRRHQKAYAGILMDAAHLSQTQYLVCGELDLGAFITIAINSRDIEARLGLDGISEGVIAMTGCGRRARGESPLELQFSSEPPS